MSDGGHQGGWQQGAGQSVPPTQHAPPGQYPPTQQVPPNQYPPTQHAPPGQVPPTQYIPPVNQPGVGGFAPPTQQVGDATAQPPLSHGAPVGGVPTPGGHVPQPNRSRTSRAAVVALVIGLLSFFLPFVGGALAIVFGLVGIQRVISSGGQRTGLGFGIAGAVLGGLSIAAWVGIVTSDGFRAGVEEALAISNLLTVGDCVDIPLDDTQFFEVTQSDVVPCSEPHVAEYIGAFDLPYDDDAPYPGEDQVFFESFDLCAGVFDTYTGTSYDERFDLDVFLAYPTGRSWRLINDREIVCFVTSVDGQPLTGSVRG